MEYTIKVSDTITVARTATMAVVADDVEAAKRLARDHASNLQNADGTPLRLAEHPIDNTPWQADLAWSGPLDHNGEPIKFRNHYTCDECTVSWVDDWSCRCNDHCPTCDAEIEPDASEDLDEHGEVVTANLGASDRSRNAEPRHDDVQR